MIIGDRRIWVSAPAIIFQSLCPSWRDRWIHQNRILSSLRLKLPLLAAYLKLDFSVFDRGATLRDWLFSHLLARDSLLIRSTLLLCWMHSFRIIRHTYKPRKSCFERVS